MPVISRRVLAASIGTVALAATAICGSGCTHSSAAHAPTPGLAHARFGGHLGTPAAHPVTGGVAHVNAAATTRKGYNINGYNWSGMVATGSGFTSTKSSWVEPSVTCNSSNDLMAPWVGIDGYGSNSVEQTGVATDCSSGSPVYAAWYEMYPQNPVYYSNTVRAGDHITATVTRSGTSYTLTLADTTRGWTKTTTKSYRGANASADFVMESPTGAYPKFGTVNFTGSTVNGSALGNFGPVAMDASNNYGYEDHTGALTGGTNFSISYLHE